MQKLEYDKFVFAINKIASRAKNFDIDSIYGIPRGGIVPAVYLAHLLKLPLVEKDFINETTLLVDDIADTGKTLITYNRLNCKIATIYYHKQSIIEPDIWIYEKRNDWILFPWETVQSTK